MMFPLPISTYIYIAIALGTAFITHRVDGYYHDQEIIAQQKAAIEHENKVVNDQAAVALKTQKDKDDLQTRYDSTIAQLRGVRQQLAAASNQPTAPAIPSQGFRLLESDAEILIGFAKQCANTEIERNDVIQKYNALMVK